MGKHEPTDIIFFEFSDHVVANGLAPSELGQCRWSDTRIVMKILYAERVYAVDKDLNFTFLKNRHTGVLSSGTITPEEFIILKLRAVPLGKTLVA